MEQDLRNLNVLLVAGDPAFRTMLREVVRSLNVSGVYLAATGGEARHRLLTDAAAVDVLLCDWQLPDTSGLDLGKELRIFARDMHFIIMSSVADRAHVELALRSGVNGYLLKPFSRAQIEAKLRAAVQKNSPQPTIPALRPATVTA